MYKSFSKKHDEYKSTFTKRLKAMYKKWGYTQETLTNALNALLEKEDDKPISLRTVKSWTQENGAFPEFDKICALCELLDCDLDYLIGRIDCTSHNLQYISDYTGLSENAIEHMAGLDTFITNVIDVVIQKPEIFKIIHNYKTEKDSLPRISGIDPGDNSFIHGPISNLAINGLSIGPEMFKAAVKSAIAEYIDNLPDLDENILRNVFKKLELPLDPKEWNDEERRKYNEFAEQNKANYMGFAFPDFTDHETIHDS